MITIILFTSLILGQEISNKNIHLDVNFEKMKSYVANRKRVTFFTTLNKQFIPEDVFSFIKN